MTKHEVDVIGGLNMTDQISNEAYKQIMVAAQDENEVGDVLDKIRAEIDEQIKYNTYFNSDMAKGEIIAFEWVKRKIDEYTKGESE